jgi:predicted dehydrogenase
MSGRLDVVFVAEPTGWHVGKWLTICAQSATVRAVHLVDHTGVLHAEARATLGARLAGTHVDVESALAAAPGARLAVVSLEPWRTPAACRQALLRDCHVLYEKPGSASVAALRDLVAIAAERRPHFVPAFPNRVLPHLLWTRDAIARGAVGEIWSVDARMYLRDRIVHAYRERGAHWLFSAEAGGGFLTFMGCHAVDLLRWLTGRELTAVAGFTGVVHDQQQLRAEDSIAFAFRLDNGALGTFTGGYALGEDLVESIAIYGSAGWIEVDFPRSERVECFARGGGDGQGRRWREPPRRLAGNADSYAVFGEACFAAALGLGDPPASPEDGLRVLEVAHAVHAAGRSGCSTAPGAGEAAR